MKKGRAEQEKIRSSPKAGTKENKDEEMEKY